MRSLLIAAFALPVALLAANGRQGGQPQNEAAKRESVQKRIRLMRIIGLADALNLDEAQALSLVKAMRPYDERRRDLQAQIAQANRVLKQAAEGDASAAGHVDQATQIILDARVQIAANNRDMFNAIGRDLSPEQRAKMALFFARFEVQLRNMAAQAQKKARAAAQAQGDDKGD